MLPRRSAESSDETGRQADGDQHMRIEQPEHLTPLDIESFRRNTRRCERGPILAVLMSAIIVGSPAQRAFSGERVASWQWICSALAGPFSRAIMTAGLRLMVSGNRFAEFQGNRVRLGPVGNTFSHSNLISCEIEPDNNFPEIKRLWFCFRLFRFARPRYWSMMVEDLAEAERFRRALAL